MPDESAAEKAKERARAAREPSQSEKLDRIIELLEQIEENTRT